jgi:DNA mismatch endonuclease Vsr
MTKGIVGRVSAKRSRIMKAVKSKNGGPELALRSTLFRLGLRYRLHMKDLPGKPDIVFVGSRVAVFCDGDFWHGRDWFTDPRKRHFRIRSAYWTQKIEGNMVRDQKVTRELRRSGWLVIRVWNSDIKKDQSKVAVKIDRAVRKRHKSGR